MSECPPRECLQQFLVGQLSGAKEESLCAHIEECSSCQNEMSRLVEGVADSEWSALRDADLARSPEEEDFLDHLKKTPPPAEWTTLSWNPAEWSGPHVKAKRSNDPVPTGGLVIPGYELLEELGRGGMGVVYKARHLGLDRIVALKTIPFGRSATLEEIARFRTEAEAAAALQHEHIVRVYDVGEHEGTPYFAMELVAGGSLRECLGGRPIPPLQAASLIEILARAAHHAHSRGIIHRDLKPANILLSGEWGVARGEKKAGSEEWGDKKEEMTAVRREKSAFLPFSSLESTISFHAPRRTPLVTPKIADFGLARRLGDLGHTRHGEIMGTPSYMAPEQASGKRVRLGFAVDVYALGAILYELLAGRPPFLGESWESTLASVLGQEPIPPRRLQPKCPRDLEIICLKCLEKEPAKRYGSALDLADDLHRFQAGQSIHARPPSLPDQWMKFAGRNKSLVAGVLGTGLALFVGAIVSIVFALGEAQQRQLADVNARQAESARQKAIKEAYQARLAAAFLALGEGESSDARRHLQAAPESLRGWEWRHLQARLLDEEPTVTHIPSAFTSGTNLLAAGRRVLVRGGPNNRYAVHDTRTDSLIQELPEGDAVWTAQSLTESVMAIYKAGAPLSLIDRSGIVRKTQVPFGPDACILAPSPRGDRLAVAWRHPNADARLEIRELPSGLPKLQIPDPHDPFTVAISPDGATLAVACGDYAIRLWDVATGTAKGVLRGNTGRVHCVVFGPDSRRLLTAGDDATLRQWDLATGTLLDAREGHHRWVLAAAYSPDGQWILTGSEDRTVRLWRSSGGPAVAVLRGHPTGIWGVAFHPDGATIVSADHAGGIFFWPSPIAPDPRVLTGHTSFVYPVVYSPDGTWLASGGWDDVIRIWDAASGEQIAVLRGAQGYVGALAVSPDGTSLTSLSRDGHLRIWNMATGELRANIADFGPIQGEPQTVSISPDGAVVACGAHERVRMWDLVTGRESPGFTSLVQGDIRLAVFHPNGRQMAVVATEPNIYLVDRFTGTIQKTLEGHTALIQTVSFSQDGRRLVSAGNDLTVRLWDTETGELQQTLQGHTEQIFAAAFLPDGTRVASGGRDRAIRIWDTTTGDELARLQGHADYVFSLAFAPGGKTLASGSGDLTVRLWDTEVLTHRRAARDELRKARPEADRLVERFFREEETATRVMQRLHAEPGLGESLRRAAWHAVLRHGKVGVAKTP